MRDYVRLLDWLRSSQNACYLYGCDECPADCENHEGDIFKDAADAIEELLKENGELENSGRVLMAAFARLKEKVPKWISVEERLPKRDERVHICFMFANKPYIEVGELWSDGKFHTEVDEYYLPMYLKERKATHWMPLPEPPKESP